MPFNIFNNVGIRCKTTSSIVSYVNPKIKTAAGIVVFPKQIWIKDAGGSVKYVYPKTEVFRVGSASYSQSLGESAVNVSFYILRGNTTPVVFPNGWTGRISFWLESGAAATTPTPVNSTPNNTSSLLVTSVMDGRQHKTVLGYAANPLFVFASQPVANDPNGQQVSSVDNGIIGNGVGATSLMGVANIVVKSDGTTFSYTNGYEISIPLATSTSIMTFSSHDQGGNGGSITYFGNSNLRMAVTTTSSVYPT